MNQTVFDQTFDEPMLDQNRYAQDSKLFTQFYTRAVLNASKSAEAGRPIFDNQPYIRIITPGNKNKIVDTEATRHYQVRFPRQWQKYQSQQDQGGVSGTPLEMWPAMTPALVAELKAMNVHVVEQLATMADVQVQKIMGGHQLKQRAQAYLNAAAGDSVNSAMQEELDKANAQAAAMQEQLTAMARELDELRKASVSQAKIPNPPNKPASK